MKANGFHKRLFSEQWALTKGWNFMEMNGPSFWNSEDVVMLHGCLLNSLRMFSVIKNQSRLSAKDSWPTVMLFYLTGKMKSLVQLKTEGRAFTNKSKEVFKKTNILNCSLRILKVIQRLMGWWLLNLRWQIGFSGKRSMFMIYWTCQESWMGLYSICSWT